MPQPRFLLPAVLLAFALFGAAAPVRAETIELKTGAMLSGEIVEYDDVKLTLDIEGARMVIKLAEIAPYQVYRLRMKHVKDGDAKAHFELGEYCRANNLFIQGKSEYDKSLALDATLDAKVKPALAALAVAEADSILAKGKAAIADGHLDEALKQLQVLLSRYPDLPQAHDAKTLLAETTASLKQRNEEKERQLKALAEQKAGKGGKGEDELTARFQEALKQIEEGKTQNAEGLDAEGATKTSRAQKAYEKGVASFREAREAVADILKNSKDVDLLAAAKEKAPELDRWLVIGYDNLGHLWAIEFNFRESLKWLNKALAIDPNDKFALELKLKMAEQYIHNNARGYVQPNGLDPNGPIR